MDCLQLCREFTTLQGLLEQQVKRLINNCHTGFKILGSRLSGNGAFCRLGCSNF